MAAPAAKKPTGTVSRYLREVRGELKKVNWPNRREVISYTSVVLLSVLAVALVIGVIDLAITQVIRLLGLIGG